MIVINKFQNRTFLGQNWADHAVTIILWGRGYESVADCVLFYEERDIEIRQRQRLTQTEKKSEDKLKLVKYGWKHTVMH